MSAKNSITSPTASSRRSSRTTKELLGSTKYFSIWSANSRMNWKLFPSVFRTNRITILKSVKKPTRTFKDWRSRSMSWMWRLSFTFSTWTALSRVLNLATTVYTDRNSASLRRKSPTSRSRLRLRKLYSIPSRLISLLSVSSSSKCLGPVTSWERRKLKNSIWSLRISKKNARLLLLLSLKWRANFRITRSSVRMKRPTKTTKLASKKKPS